MKHFEPSIEVFNERVKNNLKLYEPHQFRFWEYEFFDLKDGKATNPHTDVLSKSINDMRGAIPLGQLAIYSLHGADAFMLKDGKYIATELKTIEIDEDRLIVGADDAIYYEAPNLKRSLIESFYSIGFVVTNENLRKSKNRPTFVVLRTKRTGEIIDAFYLDGDIIYREISKGDPDVPTKSVSLRVFLNEGRKEPIKMPHIGWENWKQRILDNNTYLIRPMLQEDIKKKHSGERLELRKKIAEYKETLKMLSSKISKATRLMGRTNTQIKEEDEKLQSVKEQMEKLKVRKNTILSKIQSRMNRNVKFENMLRDIQTQVDKIDYKVTKAYEAIDESIVNEEKQIEANAALRQLIKNPE